MSEKENITGPLYIGKEAVEKGLQSLHDYRYMPDGDIEILKEYDLEADRIGYALLEARLRTKPKTITIIATPDMRDSWFFKLWQEAQHPKKPLWKKIFFPFFTHEKPIHRVRVERVD